MQAVLQSQGLRSRRVLRVVSAALLAATAALSQPARPSAHQQSPQPHTLDELLAAYRSGDFAVLERSLTRPRDFQTLMRRPDPRELDAWLRGWDRGKAVLLIDLAHVAFRVSPPYASALIRAGRAFLATSSDDGVFVVNWHRTALGVLEANGNPDLIEEYTDVLKAIPIGKLPNGQLAGRLLLARAIAQERRCWDARPTLEQPGIRLDELARAAGARIPADLDNPVPVSKAQLDLHRRCLQEAFARFDSAAAVQDTRAEARVRGAWILFQEGRPEDAVSWLDAAQPDGDRELTFWLNLFRGRALSALGRFQESADAYRKAGALYPGAQSAGIGLALQLFRLDQTSDADTVARAVQRSSGEDPWSNYSAADSRFISEYLGRLRKTIQ